eukprot:scaffold13_cov377-Prasinococcus_capsulatus_cf.AAC.23
MAAHGPNAARERRASSPGRTECSHSRPRCAGRAWTHRSGRGWGRTEPASGSRASLARSRACATACLPGRLRRVPAGFTRARLDGWMGGRMGSEAVRKREGGGGG